MTWPCQNVRMTEVANALLADLWNRQRLWSKAADRAKAEVGRYRLASLTLVIVSASTGTAAPAIAEVNATSGRICGLVAGVAWAWFRTW
jgi:hypothetical protein